MAKVLCVLYDDPVDGYPPAYARDEVPKIEGYHDGQSAPAPKADGADAPVSPSTNADDVPPPAD